MENQEAKPVLVSLTKEDLQLLFEKAAEAGAKAGIEKYEEELKRHQKQRGDKRYHNTKLLLRNYRMLQVNAEKSVFGRTQMKESAADILESMMNIYNDEIVVESIKNSTHFSIANMKTISVVSFLG